MSCFRTSPRFWRVAALALFGTGCAEKTLDAGFDVPHGLLPVDERNPILLSNDGVGNWYGLDAVLSANSGGPALAGIAVNTSSYATDLDDNLAAWGELVTAARASGLTGIPEPVGSVGAPLVRPSDGDVDSTEPNDSAGARLIVEASSRLSLPYRPLVVVAGGRLTDGAHAYLLDHGVSDRVVVVAALGSGSSRGGSMTAPNGELDPWADWIVTQHFRYVQVSAYYDSTLDLPAAELANLPKNPLSDYVAAELPNITDVPGQADQVAVLAVAWPKFVVGVQDVEQDPAASFVAMTGPELVPRESEGRAWLVTDIEPAAAGARLQQMLKGLKTSGP